MNKIVKDDSIKNEVDNGVEDTSTTYNITEIKHIINKVDSENIEEISKRRLYIIKSGINKELHYLKCGELKGVKKIPIEIMDYSINTI